MFRLISSLLAALVLCSSTSNAEDSARAPNVDGYVTRVTSAQDFDVNGIRILTSKKTHYVVGDPTIPRADIPIKPYFGQPAKAFGDLDKKHHTLATTEIRFSTPVHEGTISGFAIIDLIPKQYHSNAEQLLVRADGYLILITPDTVFRSDLPNQSIAAIHTNMWITYRGHRQPDGTIRADKAYFIDNEIAHRENDLLIKTEYDPEKVDPDAYQNDLSKTFLGLDPKRIPPYEDQAMQARINRIGKSLIPAYQKTLPESDPTKINFRFQLVDQEKWPDAITLPSGIILVPYQIVERLKDDSQLATVLADNVACAIEKQAFRVLTKAQKLLVAEVAGVAGTFIVPGVGALASIGTFSTRAVLMRHALQQSGRVSISLLSDAGYDIHEAPFAWWLIASKKPKDPADIPLPPRATYLYQIIGATTNHAQPAS